MKLSEKQRRQFQSDLAKLKAIRNKNTATLKRIEELETTLMLRRHARVKKIIKS